MIIQEETYVVIDSTKFIGKYSVYNTATGEETPCHNFHTAKTVARDNNEKLIKQVSSSYDCCEYDGAADSKVQTMNKENERLWLKWNTVLKQIQHLKFNYIATEDREIIEDMILYIKTLLEKLNKE